MNETSAIAKELTVARSALVQAKEAINLIYAMIKKHGGIHSRSCATYPQEIIYHHSNWAGGGDEPPQYTQKGPCSCGLIAMDNQVNDAVDAIDTALEQ